MTDIILGTGISILLGLLGLLYRNVINTQNDLENKIDEHIKDCHNAPRAVLFEKLEHLLENQDRNQTQNEKQFDKINIELKIHSLAIERLLVKVEHR